MPRYIERGDAHWARGFSHAELMEQLRESKLAVHRSECDGDRETAERARREVDSLEAELRRRLEPVEPSMEQVRRAAACPNQWPYGHVGHDYVSAFSDTDAHRTWRECRFCGVTASAEDWFRKIGRP